MLRRSIGGRVSALHLNLIMMSVAPEEVHDDGAILCQQSIELVMEGREPIHGRVMPNEDDTLLCQVLGLIQHIIKPIDLIIEINRIGCIDIGIASRL